MHDILYKAFWPQSDFINTQLSLCRSCFVLGTGVALLLIHGTNHRPFCDKNTLQWNARRNPEAGAETALRLCFRNEQEQPNQFCMCIRCCSRWVRQTDGWLLFLFCPACVFSVGEHERSGQYGGRQVPWAEEHHRQSERPDQSGSVSGYLPCLRSRWVEPEVDLFGPTKSKEIRLSPYQQSVRHHFLFSHELDTVHICV